jgi:ribonuclease P protein component
MPPLKFLPRQRLAHARQYQAVYAGKVQRTRAGLGMTGAPNDAGFTRLGLSVSKRIGSAVKRNRAKRLIREAFRLGQRDLPAGFDLIVSVRGSGDLDLASCREAITEMAASIAREWERRS